MNEANNLIGRESHVVPGRFGEPLHVSEVLYSRDHANATPTRPLLLLLHGWGSNEQDLPDLMHYIAPFNDWISLRAPLTLAQGAYSWFHDSIPQGKDLDRDIYAAARAIDQWVVENVPEQRSIVPLGFSQGGALAIQLLRIHAERYKAAVCLSGFMATGALLEAFPDDENVDAQNIATFYGHGDSTDMVVPTYDVKATSAWLSAHTFLTEHTYRGLDHSVSMQELADLRQWMLEQNISSGLL
ncbi:esterase [Bifidobacterium dolichotidis]|uniref:Esterase n=1 Tax=Bifidobacterium dolichotidis TaxID=2306976 RepID=A0A430FNV7_9BIFI|nr:esterase [Bifidobacterium dolichotidis]RSX54506.1 esterase [Bifidobacterium dolichotidis]